MTEPLIRSTADGATLKVRVIPGAHRDGIVGVHADALKIAVRQPPERGRANREVARLLAAAVGGKERDIEVLAGATGRDKVLLFRGWEAARLRAGILVLLGHA